VASRASLNKVLLIGNLTRDPELRYTPSGAAVCSFGIATNRVYVSSDGTKKEEAEFTKIVSWNKLAELCAQLLTKGRKVYVEGRLQTRSWETPDGVTKQTTEVVIDDMRILDSRRAFEEGSAETARVEAPEEKAPAAQSSQEAPEKEVPEVQKPKKKSKGKDAEEAAKEEDAAKSDAVKVDLDDLPF